MDLKTHTAYPEIQVDPDTNNWKALLYTREGGNPIEEFTGAALNRKDAIKKASSEIDKVAENYLIQ